MSEQSNSAVDTEILSKEDMVDFLKDDETDIENDLLTEKTKKEDKEETTKEDEEEELEEKDEKELKDPEDDIEFEAPPARKAILKEFPDFFKKFPYVEKAIYREQKYAELLPTIDDAKVAVEKSQALDNFENDLRAGNTETLFKAIKEEDSNSFHKMADGILGAISRVDKEAYNNIVGNIVKMTIINLANEASKRGKDNGGEILQNTATVLHQFVFGNSEWKPPAGLAKKDEANPEAEKISERERALNEREFTTAVNGVTSKLVNRIESTIKVNIDPKESMTEYVRNHAINEAKEKVDSLMMQDTRFRANYDKLWEAAVKSGYRQADLDRLSTFYISKAKTLLPEVIKQARINALKGMGKRVSEDSGKDKSPVTPGKSTAKTTSGNKSDSKAIPPRMRTLDYLNQD